MKRADDAQVIEIANWVRGLAPWSVFMTPTFRWEASLESARRCFEKFMRMQLPEVSYFYAIEENPSRDGHHVHALWADCEAVLRRGVWERWFEKYGRARIEPVRSKDDVTDYCGKYVCKASAWWNFKLVSPDLWHAQKKS
jgi:hypothetical protein